MGLEAAEEVRGGEASTLAIVDVNEGLSMASYEERPRRQQQASPPEWEEVVLLRRGVLVGHCVMVKVVPSHALELVLSFLFSCSGGEKGNLRMAAVEADNGGTAVDKISFGRTASERLSWKEWTAS